jgi:hypothetical protein
MNRSESIGKLAAALAKAQGAMHGAMKDSKNPHFNSRYADLASIVDAAREPLAQNEISVVQNAGRPESGLVSMTTLLLHSSGEWLESDPLVVQAKDAGPQAVGSCLTYLRRYQLAAMVGIAPEDDDAEAGEGRAVSSQQAARPAAIQQKANYYNQRPPAPKPQPSGPPKPPIAQGKPVSESDIPF